MSFIVKVIVLSCGLLSYAKINQTVDRVSPPNLKDTNCPHGIFYRQGCEVCYCFMRPSIDTPKQICESHYTDEDCGYWAHKTHCNEQVLDYNYNKKCEGHCECIVDPVDDLKTVTTCQYLPCHNKILEENKILNTDDYKIYEGWDGQFGYQTTEEEEEATRVVPAPTFPPWYTDDYDYGDTEESTPGGPGTTDSTSTGTTTSVATSGTNTNTTTGTTNDVTTSATNTNTTTGTTNDVTTTGTTNTVTTTGTTIYSTSGTTMTTSGTTMTTSGTTMTTTGTTMTTSGTTTNTPSVTTNTVTTDGTTSTVKTIGTTNTVKTTGTTNTVKTSGKTTTTTTGTTNPVKTSGKTTTTTTGTTNTVTNSGTTTNTTSGTTNTVTNSGITTNTTSGTTNNETTIGTTTDPDFEETPSTTDANLTPPKNTKDANCPHGIFFRQGCEACYCIVLPNQDAPKRICESHYTDDDCGYWALKTHCDERLLDYNYHRKCEGHCECTIDPNNEINTTTTCQFLPCHNRFLEEYGILKTSDYKNIKYMDLG